MSNVSIFKFENTADIRVVEIEGNPWFVAMDVSSALSFTYDNLKYHAKQTLGSAEKRVVKLPGFRGNGGMVVSESGLYKLIMRSDKPEARRFQDWVTRDVLPAIRKDGAYIMGEEKVATGEMDEDAFVLKAIEILQRKIDRLKEEKAKLTVENQELTHERDGLSSVVCTNYHTLAHFARKLPEVNSMQVQKGLKVMHRSSGRAKGSSTQKFPLSST